MGVRAAAVGHACVCKTSRYNFQFPNYYTYLVSSWRHTYILSNILGIYNSTTNFQEFYPNYYYASGRQNMLGNSSVSFQQINNFYAEKVQLRRIEIKKAIETVAGVIQDILKGVEYLEPRFISTFTQTNGRYDGFLVHSLSSFEVILYLNQMGVFNFVDDGTIPGHAVLKLSDGRKRSMSLWVEFITASGYLSARKIRSRFQALVSQTVEKAPFQESCKIIADSSDVKVLIYGKYTVQFTCAFRCNGIWPRSVNQWPGPLWPNPEVVKDIQLEGFDLVSKEITPSTSPYSSQQQQQLSGGGGKSPNLSGQLTPTGTSSSQQSIGGIPMQTTTNTMESDAWAISMEGAERNLFSHPVRAKALKIVKTLRDRHLDYEESTTTNHLLKTLVLWEFEKHPNDHEWQDFCLGDRIIGIFIQLISCLQCRRCPHYFLPQLDLLRGKSPRILDENARSAWNLVRQMLLNVKALETL